MARGRSILHDKDFKFLASTVRCPKMPRPPKNALFIFQPQIRPVPRTLHLSGVRLYDTPTPSILRASPTERYRHKTPQKQKQTTQRSKPVGMNHPPLAKRLNRDERAFYRSSKRNPLLGIGASISSPRLWSSHHVRHLMSSRHNWCGRREPFSRAIETRQRGGGTK